MLQDRGAAPPRRAPVNIERGREMDNPKITPGQSGKKWDKTSITGLIVFILFLLALLVFPQHVAGIFSAMSAKAFNFGLTTYLLTTIAGSVIVSVMSGRLLEKAGVTDALVKLFTPVSRLLKINPTVLVPGIYNFIGDVNAASKITSPILANSGTTKHEKMIAIATEVQFAAAFGALLQGIYLLAAGGVNAFLMILLAYILPLFLVPLILRCTIYRKCEYRDVMESIPSFTPKGKSWVDTIFGGVIEGADVLIRLIMPTTCGIYAIVAVLEYVHAWPYIESAFQWVLALCNIEPVTGMNSLLISGIVGMPQLTAIIEEGTQVISQGMVASSFMFGAACMNFVLPCVQIPMIWNQNTDLTFGEAFGAAISGWVLRLILCALVGYVIIPIIY